MSDEIVEILTPERILGSSRFKHGFLKCRLVHMAERSFVQPDVLLSDQLRKEFHVPKFIDPNRIAFFDEDAANHCQLTFATVDGGLIRVFFYQRDLITIYPDNSLLYRCYYAVLEGHPSPRGLGVWRRRGRSYQLRLYHHTNEAGYAGITSSGEIWGSRRNIQGNMLLDNIAYGYFTSLSRIDTEEHLMEIAMSRSGLTGFVPTNAPFHPRYATLIPVPKQDAIHRSRTVSVWVDIELLAPNHLWLHRPMDKAAYYEVVLPKVFRIGLQPDAVIPIHNGIVQVGTETRKLFEYVVVGDADTHEGLEAPYNEQNTTMVAHIETVLPNSDIISRWRELGNSYRFQEMEVEYAELTEEQQLQIGDTEEESS